MARDVSCKVLEDILRSAAQKQISIAQLLEGTGLTAGTVADKEARITWAEYVRFMERISALWSEAELLAMGRGHFESRYMRPVSVVARLLFSATDFYRWVFQKSLGPGNQSFACVEPSFSEIAPGRLELILRLPLGFPTCQAFFVISKGTFEGMPRVLGLPPARVEMSPVDRGYRYEVFVPSGGGWLNRAKRALIWPFTVTAAAAELKAAHETLKRRYDELDEAKRLLTSQAEQLKTVNDLGRELTRHTSLDAFGTALGTLLTERFECEGVRLTAVDEANEVRTVYQTGKPSGEATGFALVAGNQRIGRLEVWGLAERHELLHDLIPWFAIAFDNVRSFERLREYQQHLEKRVDERTRQLQEALAYQKELDRQKTEFFANASHELRTPLTLLVGPLETLTNDPKVPDPVRLEITAALRNGYRLIKLVNDLLDLAKIEAGKMHLKMGPTHLSHLLEESVRPWRAALNKREIQLDYRVPASLRIIGDAERLEQVMLNLVANAIKHTPDGGRIRVEADTATDRTWFVIENTGEGIHPDDLDRVFERFGQSAKSRSRRFGSTGLGLSVVRELVELHGGKVTIQNTPGEKVAFRVELPTGGEADEAARESTPRAGSAELKQYEVVSVPETGATIPVATTGDRPTVLVVEDNADLRNFVVRGLSASFDVYQASNGEEALALATSKLPDLVLSDLMMPEMDGLELCKRLRAGAETSGIPFVILTARSDVEGKVIGLGEGADDYIVKPFYLEEVMARLQTQLRLKALRQRVAAQEKLVALGTVVGGVAHEIRNPLNGIVNALGPLKRVIGEASPQAQQLLEIAIQGAERVSHIAGQLVLHARAGEGGKSELDLGANIDLALRLLEPKITGGPKVTTDVPKDVPVRVIGEPGALNQVWINLIDNAIQAAGQAGHVTVKVSQLRDGACVEVADDGPGIEPKHLKRIFDPFFTTKPVGVGTGLGLSLAREIVQQHGGSISVQSQPGAGARFSVVLPSGSGGAVHAEG